MIDSHESWRTANAVRVTVSTSFVPAGADRQIGVWCVPPVTNPVWSNRKMKRSRNPEGRFGLESPRKEPATVKR